MANEPTIRNLFLSDEGTPRNSIDVARVIRRSRARRLPKQIGFGGVFTLAIGGVGLAGVQGFSALQGSSTSAGSADAPNPESLAGPNVDAGGIKRAPADKINLCGGTLAEVAPSESGLVLIPHFPNATAGSASVEGSVSMTNTGTEAVSGYTSPPLAITLSQNGIVLWHSNGPTTALARQISLAPGESIVFEATINPVVCSVEDDEKSSFREGLPSALPGEYQVSAAMDFQFDSGAELVTGPPTTITLH
jgi:hypothetical protein